MNDDRPRRRRDSIGSEATTGHRYARPAASALRRLADSDDAAMAASVAMPERFQRPTTAAAMMGGGGGGDHVPLARRGRGCRPRVRGCAKYNSVSAGSALSASMRYADGWLYGRDAVVAAGGTVDGRGCRTRSTFFGHEHFGPAAVVAMAAATSALPTAAAGTEDPYERVRRNRMAGAVAATVGQRDRSGSSRTPSPDYYDDGGRANAFPPTSSSPRRRSILECDVNPYDLLKRGSDEDRDEDDEDVNDRAPKRMSLRDKFVHRIQDAVFARNRTSVGGFGSFTNGSAKKTTTAAADKNCSGVNIAGHTVRLFDGKCSSTGTATVSSSVWYDDGSAADVAAPVCEAVTAATTVQSQSPMRPPRRRSNRPAMIAGPQGLTKRSHSLTVGATSAATAEIKSILKKPTSRTTDDLSPVRSLKAVTAVSEAVAPMMMAAGSLTASSSQKKAKKQVQFDIVSASPEKPNEDGGVKENEDSSSLPQLRRSQRPTGVDATIATAVDRKLKRSLSDRQRVGTCGKTSDDVTAFNDTMRIHVRHKGRPDSRAAFERPADPPPPPPPPSTTTGDGDASVVPSVTELFLRRDSDARDRADNRTVVQVSPETRRCAADGVTDEPEHQQQKTSILINSSSPGLKTSVIIGEGGAAYAASSDNKVTISIGPGKRPGGAVTRGGNYRSNVTVVDPSCSPHMSEFIRMNYDPVRAARLDVTPHVCGRRSSSANASTPLVDPYRVSEIEKHSQSPSDTESSSAESCYASAKEDASYSSASSFSSSSSSARSNDAEPIYEEILCESPVPPPLPSCPPPERGDTSLLHSATLPSRSIFEGATKHDIINYLVDARRRCGALQHDSGGGGGGGGGGPSHPVCKFAVQQTACATDEPHSASESDVNGACNDSGEEYGSMGLLAHATEATAKKASADVERNDSGVGSETSQSSRSKWRQQHETQHGCEDCDQPVEIQTTDGGIVFAPLVCRKCHKRRAERREIIAEIVETEEKYGRDLDIIAEEFYRPMMVAGLLHTEQLSSVFLNVSELKEHSAALSQRLRDAYEIAVEQGDDDLLTVNIGRLFLEASPSMLHAFQSYCTRQGNAALLLANLEKEKELLRIFLRVSQMENAVLRRMNLNSFLMVPVQRVTKYPLLLARLYKVTPEHHLEARQTLNEARHKIQLHLEHINSLAKDISSTKLWRKIYAINGKRPDSEDLADIKFRKVAVDVLEWSGLGEEIRFAMEGRLLYTQPSDHNWRRGGRTIKLMPINAIIVTLGKPNDNYNPEVDDMAFPRQNGIRDASLVLLKEKSGRISLLREPMYLDRCVVCCESDWDDYFELHEITTKDTYILKAPDGEQTKMWYRQLQYHCQTLGCWRKRRNALANIMINRNCT